MNVVILQSLVENSGQCRIEDGDGQGERNDENAADGSHDRRGQATPSAQEREEAHHDFHHGRDDGHNVRNEHPFGHRLVGLQTVPKLFVKQLVLFGPGESPYLHRIKPEG